jgi:Bacterial Ig domain
MTRRVAHAAQIGALILALALVPAGFAAKGGGGGKGGCTRNTPRVEVDNNWAWSSPGSWGMSGQKLTYAIQVMNQDVGCNSSSFEISASAPSGFSVSIPTSTVSLRSSRSAYLWAYVTSPGAIADGDYPLTFTATRAGTSGETSSFTSYYKIYSSDTTAPTMFWPNPGPGQTISGRSFNVVVSAKDDHAVKKIDLFMDGAHMLSTACENIAYYCDLNYQWQVGAPGQHTARFEATDWMGNVGVETVNFTVG